MFSLSTLVYALNNSIPRKLGLSRLTYWSRSQHKHFSLQICHPYLVLKIRVSSHRSKSMYSFLGNCRFSSIHSGKCLQNASKANATSITHKFCWVYISHKFLYPKWTEILVTVKSDAISHDPTHANPKKIQKFKIKIQAYMFAFLEMIQWEDTLLRGERLQSSVPSKGSPCGCHSSTISRQKPGFKLNDALSRLNLHKIVMFHLHRCRSQ